MNSFFSAIRKKGSFNVEPENSITVWKNATYFFFCTSLILCVVVVLLYIRSLPEENNSTEATQTSPTDSRLSQNVSQKSDQDGWVVYQDAQSGFQVTVPENWITDETCQPEEAYDGFCAYHPSYTPPDPPPAIPGQEFVPWRPPQSGAIFYADILRYQSGQNPIEIDTQTYCDELYSQISEKKCYVREHNGQTILMNEIGSPQWRVSSLFLNQNFLEADVSIDYASEDYAEVALQILESFEFIDSE